MSTITKVTEWREIFAMRACMSAVVIDYALCGCRRSPKE
jgi:hypothetical protein